MLVTDTLGDTLKGQHDKTVTQTVQSIHVDSKEKVKRIKGMKDENTKYIIVARYVIII